MTVPFDRGGVPVGVGMARKVTGRPEPVYRKPDRELLLCPAEDFASRCDHPGNPTRMWPVHLCEYDDHHDGQHKCICGHEWKEDD